MKEGAEKECKLKGGGAAVSLHAETRVMLRALSLSLTLSRLTLPPFSFDTIDYRYGNLPWLINNWSGEIRIGRVTNSALVILLNFQFF